jgi:hypothetical protein
MNLILKPGRLRDTQSEGKITPPAAKGLFLSRLSADGWVEVLWTCLAGEEYQFLCTHTVRIDIGEELKTHSLKIIQAEVCNFNPIHFIGCKSDCHTIQ